MLAGSGFLDDMAAQSLLGVDMKFDHAQRLEWRLSPNREEILANVKHTTFMPARPGVLPTASRGFHYSYSSISTTCLLCLLTSGL
jgi:hypothetical protein